ncbi:hypothetical protein N431DRAFT_291415, partial [Stipitochalara longipes BDJ]
EQYNRLLFEDENFTRPGKFFWIIGCLGELIVCIADNVNQWDLYQEARVQPLLDKPNFAYLLDAACVQRAPFISDEEDAKFRAKRRNEFENLVKSAQKQQDRLKNLQTQFENKLERAKILRDGLFSASALVESRESTRLGQNVKLLTYVSIFYLPLAFCAALWAIPNIQEKATEVPFIVTTIIVGAVTYAIVFNIDFMATKLITWYLPRRQAIVRAMKKDSRWGATALRLGDFKQPGIRKVTTEWWIPLFVIRQL